MGWRIAALAGAGAGLALSPRTPDPGGHLEALLLVGALAMLAFLRPSSRWQQAARLSLVFLAGSGLGLICGAARVAAIDAGALQAEPGSRLTVSGHVAAVPRRSGGTVRIEVETPGGRLLVESPEPVGDLLVGEELRIAGRTARPPDYLAATLRRRGIATVLRCRGIEPTGSARGGLAGRLDAIRSRAEEGLGRGMPEREAALGRGFVLGQDDRIDPTTAEDFRRSGLSHLLAVSGQNVVLLGLLAVPLLAALGIGLRQRLLWTCGLIAAYVPLAGAGPSIQRAGIMGAAALLATIAGRPGSRAYALLLAASLTLLLNPLASGDVGWQLSFAAVVGIFLLAAPIRAALCAGPDCRGWRRAAAEGVAVTTSATIATAPLITHHFGTFSVGSLPANLLALPAVAPAMWLGMASAAVAQLPAVPVEPLNWLNSALLAYIAQVAAWFGRPGWATVEVTLEGPLEVAAGQAALLGLAATGLRVAAQRRTSGGDRRAAEGPRLPPRRLALIAVAAGLAIATTWPGWRTAVGALARPAGADLADGAGGGRDAQSGGLRVDVLDVDQGDAILLRPPRGEPVLVDGGPPGEDLVGKLRAVGVERLAAAIVTHDQSDHAGGIREVLGALPIGSLAYATAGEDLIGMARASGARPLQLAEGGRIRSGGLRLEVLWPPRLPGGAGPAADPNQRSLVMLARWRSFAMLLTGDAEAESVPLDPGPIDALKVSHHGSEDTGLGALLERTSPALAIISVGGGNPFGHPAPATLATLREHGTRVVRTDRDGTVALEVGRTSFTVGAGD